MRRLVGVIGACALVLATRAGAQDKPNFAGAWTSDAAPATGGRGADGGGRAGGGGGRGRGGDMGSGWGSIITITQIADQLTVEYSPFSRGDMQPPLKFVYALDGTETKNSVMLGRGVQRQTSKTVWDGAKLAITTLHHFPSPTNGQPMTSEVKQVLSLESPTSLVVETTRTGVLGAATSTTRTVYARN